MDTASSTEIQPAVTPPQPAVTPLQPAVTPLQPAVMPLQPAVTPLQPAVTPPQPVVTPAQPAVTPLELLYGKLTLNTSLLVTIDNLKRKGFNNSDIPCLILSVLEVYNSYTSSTRAHTLTVDDVQTLLERVYNYLVDKYDLVAPSERLAMYSLFNASLKLCLAVPNVKKEVTSCLKFFRC